MATLTTLFTFDAATNGAFPFGNLVIGADGDVIGGASLEGPSGHGAIYVVRSLGNGAYASSPEVIADLGAFGGDGVVDLARNGSGDVFALTGGLNGYGLVVRIPYLGEGAYGTPSILVQLDATNGYNGTAIAVDKTGNVFFTTEGDDDSAPGNLTELPWNGAGYDVPKILGEIPVSAGVDGMTIDDDGAVLMTAGLAGAHGAILIASPSANYSVTTLVAFDDRFIQPSGDLAIGPSGALFGATVLYDAGRTPGALFLIAKEDGAYAQSPTLVGVLGGPVGSYPVRGVVVDGQGDVFGTTARSVGGPGTLYEAAADGAGGYTAPVALLSLPAYPSNQLTADSNGVLLGAFPNAAGGGQFFTVSGSGFQTACYVEGTLIATPSGERRIETLAAGDLVMTDDGPQPVIWMGFRTIDCRAHPRPAKAWPYRVVAGALGEGVPARDLWISPGHAVALVLDGVEHLVRIEALANASTIRQIEVDHVTYWHVELARHAVIVAEGARSESYLDTGNRAGFANAPRVDLFADFSPGPAHTTADYCRPYVDEGVRLEQAIALVADRVAALGWTLEPVDPDAHLLIDGVRIEPHRVGPWAVFPLPANAADVRLRSGTFVPKDVVPGRVDARPHGAMVRGLAVQDRAGRHEVAMEDARFGDGFYDATPSASGAYRWTSGDARLDPALWVGRPGPITLHVKLWASPEARRWTPPAEGLRRRA